MEASCQHLFVCCLVKMVFRKMFPSVNYFFFIYILVLAITPFTGLISCVIFIIAYFVSCLFSNYGKFISYFDVWLDEDFVSSVPQSSIVVSLSLQGDLCLEELRSIFTENVLEVRSKVNPRKSRYPELKQYVTTLICFRIWKNDPNFKVENHIVEKTWNGSDLSDIHQEYQNKIYEKRQSPWELVLIRNTNFDDDAEKVQKTLLVLRIHHVMADGKSLLKLLIECLGNKKLKTANTQLIPGKRFDKVRFLLNFPLKLVWALYNHTWLLCSNFNHPWRLRNFLKGPNFQKNKTVVAFSPKLSMSKIKDVAKQNAVKSSSVVMSIIAGAIRKHCEDKWDKNVSMAYPLPKENHPDNFINHMYMGIMNLATGEQCAFKRLQKCNKEFNRVKVDQDAVYTNTAILLGGLQLYPLNRLFANLPVPFGITNNAGDEEGFSVGNAKCVDFRMSVGTCRGAIGVLFCTISYQDRMRIAVIAKESVISKEIANSVAEQIENELHILMKSP